MTLEAIINDFNRQKPENTLRRNSRKFGRKIVSKYGLRLKMILFKIIKLCLAMYNSNRVNSMLARHSQEGWHDACAQWTHWHMASAKGSGTLSAQRSYLSWASDARHSVGDE